MKCTNCGFENEENARICESCGAQMTQEAAKAPEETNEAPKETSVFKKLLKNKTALIGIAAIAAIVLLLVIVISAIANSGNGFIELEEQYLAIQNEDGDIAIIKGKKLLKNTIDLEEPEESYFSSQEESMDGKVLAGIAEDTLYVIRKNKVTKVAEDVEDFALSVEGNVIVYSVVDEEEEEMTLVYYTVKNGKTKEIAVSDEESYVSKYILSPDGEAVAYTVSEFDEDEEDGTKSTVYYFNGKKSEKITSNDIDLIAMANKGKYIYATATEETDEGSETTLYIYNKKGEKKTKLGKVASKSMLFNADCTQVIYYTQNDKGDTYSYMSLKGKEGIKLAKARLSLISTGMDVAYCYVGNSRILPVDDLYNHAYVGVNYSEEGGVSYDAYLVKKGDGKTVKLVSDVTNYTLDESGEFLYYMESDDDDNTLKVLKIKKGENAKDKAVTIAEEVESYVVTSDRKKVYFISEESLYRVNGKKGGKTKTIASDEVTESLVISDKDVVYYVDSDDTLYATTGGKGKKLMDDVDDVVSVLGNVYTMDEDGGLYFVNKKQKPKKIVDMYVEEEEESNPDYDGDDVG